MYRKTTIYVLALLALLGAAMTLSACEDFWGDDDHHGGHHGGHHDDGGHY